MFTQIFEIGMLVCFGAAWPFSIQKSLRSRTTAGKSVVFLWVILFGYVFGIANKLINQNYRLVLGFYFLNLVMVGIDLFLYYRNRGMERQVNS